MRLRFQRVGDIIVVKDRFFPREGREELAAGLARRLGAKSVVVDYGVEGELRRPKMRVIYGSETETVHRENGVAYRLDLRKVMFSKGNVHERKRLTSLVGNGETVVDMFAGIGYFALQIAKHTGASRVIACEKNPDAFSFLLENIWLNGLAERVQPFLGDCVSSCPEHVADRVILGYLWPRRRFIEKALRVLRDGGWLHVHATGRDVGEWLPRIGEWIRELGHEVVDSSWRRVKSYAPKVYHFAFDLRVSPRQGRSP